MYNVLLVPVSVHGSSDIPENITVAKIGFTFEIWTPIFLAKADFFAKN